MAVKRFYAADMHTAMNKIRNQLGMDAVILGTRQLADGVEVSASAGAADAGNRLEADSTASFSSGFASAAGGSTDKTGQNPWYLNSISGFEEEHSALHSELGSISSLLKQWMDNQGWDSYSTRSPLHAKLWERFRNLGLEPELICKILSVVEGEPDLKSAWKLALSELSRRLPVYKNDLVESGGVFAFLGATGVGKTTSIGKLATRFVLRHGADSVALITTDRYRIAAHEQLRTFGKILGVTVHAVDDSNSLDHCLEILQDKKLVLIDTAGLNRNHKNFDEQLNLLQQVNSRIQSILVLAATSQTLVQMSELEAYEELNLRGAIITKTDEAVSLGESLGIAISQCLPVAYSTHGQSIPEDIAVADANKLVNSAVQISRHRAVNKDHMIAGFSAARTNTAPQEAVAASVA